jgi:molybdopterin biosynthesis enzyme
MSPPSMTNDRLSSQRGAGLSSILVKSDGTVHIERGQEGLEAGAGCSFSLYHAGGTYKTSDHAGQP